MLRSTLETARHVDWRRLLARLARSALPVALPTAWLAWATLGAVLDATGGVPAAPLDDTYIHLQFARSFAIGEPLVYTTGTPPVAGATSLLWPALLAIPYALGCSGHSLLWAAWLLAFTALGLLAHEARAATRGLGGPLAGIGAAALVLAFGANAWFAASGMEVLPLAWLMLRAVRRASEWAEGADDDPRRTRRHLYELVALAALAPLMRPEGALASLLVGVTLLTTRRRQGWRFALLAWLSVGLGPLANWAMTGQATSTTALAKWLPLNPYTTPASLFEDCLEFAGMLVRSLLDGDAYSALFLPRGSAPFALLSLAALPVAGARRGMRARGWLLFALALGMLLPGTYECSLCNRLRYLWPFLPAWMVGAAALSELVSDALARRVPTLAAAGTMALGGLVGALLGHLPYAIHDVAESAAAISQQQVSLGLWARRALPPAATIGVNDTGAIGYFSERRSFDVVGLTTAGEARYWTAGAGSRLEHYERLGRARLPSHFIVYPEWFAIEPLLGDYLGERYVPGATILGGHRMVAHVADYSLLGSGERPEPDLVAGRTVVDRLDVADLESEAEHAYALLDARKSDNVALSSRERLDGGRRERARDEFDLELRAGGALLVRVAADHPLELELDVAGRVARLDVPASAWHAALVELPAGTPNGRARVSLTARGARFASLSYFSLGPRR